MRNVAPEPELAALLTDYDASGGVLYFIFLGEPFGGLPHELHREAALAGAKVIDNRSAHWSLRLHWDANKLTGSPVDFATFWGTDDIEPKQLTEDSFSLPDVDGYKTAFFHPPHGLGGTALHKAELFEGINKYLLGTQPEQAEIYSWSTDWSNFFDAGHEWWGAFFWTIRRAGSQRFGVVAASTSD